MSLRGARVHIAGCGGHQERERQALLAAKTCLRSSSGLGCSIGRAQPEETFGRANLGPQCGSTPTVWEYSHNVGGLPHCGRTPHCGSTLTLWEYSHIVGAPTFGFISIGDSVQGQLDFQSPGELVPQWNTILQLIPPTSPWHSRGTRGGYTLGNKTLLENEFPGHSEIQSPLDWIPSGAKPLPQFEPVPTSPFQRDVFLRCLLVVLIRKLLRMFSQGFAND
jgi:hypothetical protein